MASRKISRRCRTSCRITIDLYDERLRRLTKAQWIGVLDFVKYTGAKLLISLSSCAAWGPLDLRQTEKIFRFSHDYGIDIIYGR